LPFKRYICSGSAVESPKIFALEIRFPSISSTTIKCTALRSKYNPEFHGFSNGISEDKCIAFFDGKCEIFRADNSLTYDRNAYINRVLSSSYSLREGDEKYNSYL